MADFLCEMFRRLQVVGVTQDGVFWLPLTPTQLADVLGRSRAMVNSAAGLLRDKRLITWEAPRLEILHWDGLVELGEFDATYLQLSSMPV